MKNNSLTPERFIDNVNKYRQEELLTNEQANELIGVLLNGKNFTDSQKALYNQARVQSLSGEIIPLKIMIDTVIARLEAIKDEPQFYNGELKNAGNIFLKRLDAYSNQLFKHSSDEQTNENMFEVTARVDRINEVFRGQKAFKTLEMLFIVIDQASNGHNTIQSIDDKDYEKSLIGLEIYNKVEGLLSAAIRERNSAETTEEYDKASHEISIYTKLLHKVK